MSESSTETAPPGGVDYLTEEATPRFQELKRKHRSFVFPMSVAFLRLVLRVRPALVVRAGVHGAAGLG